ncbi:hypothetical protein N7462_010427 [Penicillium macrosclerotiorum]|uniref:uncharacterized protein n=1 Tax=Penicillium macrosclerotiorum TaxID=303699 RepID=UPI002547CCC1|nr:uncharacterized protein N7462_010427 [Penicillium macrosclerotiorum]KAJ5669357.1 hypothetical protein N7462_010427 [Penicillium macrosclerotiorum]
MSVPTIAKATLQAAAINAGSNVLAQAIKANRSGVPFELDVQALMQFTTCAFILSPLAFLWLQTLEALFPGKKAANAASEKKVENSGKASDAEAPALDITNTIIKVVIDQLIGGAWNAVVFITAMGLLRGQSLGLIRDQIRQEFWPIITAGLKLWPFVSILNFTVVPASQRLLVGSLFGVLWAVYLSLMAG